MAAPLPIVLPPPVAATLLLAHRWRRERCLLCLLWVGAAASPALIPLFPGVSAAGATLLGLAVALGAMGEMRLLRQRPTWARLRAVSALATVLEWQCGLGVIALMAFDPGSEAPTLLLVLLVLTAARYGLRGLAGATLGAILAVAMLVLAQVGPLGVLAPAEVRDVLRDWGWPLEGLTLALALLLAPSEVGRCHPPTLPAVGDTPTPAPAAIPPTPCPSAALSPREAEILALLAQGLTQKEIAHQLHIAPSTVKTHLEHLAPKLGATGTSRRAILRATQQPDAPDRAQGPFIPARTRVGDPR